MSKREHGRIYSQVVYVSIFVIYNNIGNDKM